MVESLTDDEVGRASGRQEEQRGTTNDPSFRLCGLHPMDMILKMMVYPLRKMFWWPTSPSMEFGPGKLTLWTRKVQRWDDCPHPPDFPMKGCGPPVTKRAYLGLPCKRPTEAVTASDEYYPLFFKELISRADW